MSQDRDELTDKSLPPDLVAAYAQTEYWVNGDKPTILRVGVVSEDLAAMHLANGVVCSAFITACNPWSQALDEEANAERQAELARELTRRGFTFIHGIGQHPSSQWPGEASFLVFGISLEAAKSLGSDCEQNAIIWSDSDAVPQLFLLGPVRVDSNSRDQKPQDESSS